MPYSYKRLARKLLTNIKVKRIKNNELFLIKKDKILLLNYLIKFLVFERDLPTDSTFSSRITKNSFYFNRKTLLNRLFIVRKKISQIKNNNFFIKYFKVFKNFFMKNSLQKKLKLYSKFSNASLSNFLLSGKVQYI